MNRFAILFSFVLCGYLFACSPSAEDGHSHDMEEDAHAHGADDDTHAHDGDDAHAHDGPTETYTIWTEKTELFVEFRALVAGEKSTFAAHFSEQEYFKPITEGTVTASLVKGTKGIRHKVDGPTSPGIFRPALLPKEAGIYQLIFDISTPTLSDKIVLDSVRVYESNAQAKQATPHPEEAPNEISFLKEQAWKINFANAPVKRDTIFEVIRAGGEIIPTQGNEKTVSATADGILLFKKRNANIGSQVSNRELLFAIAGGGIIDRDLEARFQNARSTLEQVKSAYDRKAELYEIRAIAKPEYETSKLAYELAKTEFETVSASYSKGGKSIYAPQQGYLKQLFKSEGAYVEAGEPLAIISENKTVTLRADVDPSYYNRLSTIHSANFTSNQKTFSLEDLNGKLLSYGKGVSRENPKVPVYFELANTADLLPGSFAEVFIQLRPTANGLLIPASALLEEYGNYSVVVQKSGESFELRNVQIGQEDGQLVEILSGLAEGERVVSLGAFQVKMASMSGQAPAHGHSH